MVCSLGQRGQFLELKTQPGPRQSSPSRSQRAREERQRNSRHCRSSPWRSCPRRPRPSSPCRRRHSRSRQFLHILSFNFKRQNSNLKPQTSPVSSADYDLQPARDLSEDVDARDTVRDLGPRGEAVAPPDTKHHQSFHVFPFQACSCLLLSTIPLTMSS